jgi:membrane-associated phospholipid phosphatase
MALLLVFSNATAVLSYLVVSTNAPLIDSTLSAWDKSIGFEWWSLFSWMQRHLLLRHIFQVVYNSLLPQLVFVVIFLGFTGRIGTLVRFIEVIVLCSMITILISGLFPAAGAWKFYAVGPQVDTQIVSHFDPLRNGALRTIDLLNMQGLISIPSFHTVLALLIIHSMWRSALAFPFLILNVAMLISTPIEGGHYLVDLLAGAVLAVTTVAFSKWYEQSIGLPKADERNHDGPHELPAAPKPEVSFTD